MAQKIDFWNLLRLTQEYISANYSAALTDQGKNPQVKNYIQQYIRENDYFVEKSSLQETIDRIYNEMVQYSILTDYLGSENLEEININSWNDIALTYLDGTIQKMSEHFQSPQHAVDIVKRLLHHSGMIIDDGIPKAQGHLPHNTRISVLKDPVLDPEVGVAASIRLLHPAHIVREKLIEYGCATQEMIDFMCTCMRYGVSTVVAGATSTGKTSLLNALLGSIPNEKRIFTIESGCRELYLVREENGKIVNNVIHTLSRPSENPAYDISQEDLVAMALRFNPNLLIVGEMRDTEAYAAQEAALTGITVGSSVHSTAAAAAHMRIALLCQKRFSIDFQTSLMQAGQAFPLIAFTHKLENNVRKVMDISECEILDNGERKYRQLYRYRIIRNTFKDGKYDIEGVFEKMNVMSDSLKRRLMQYGVPQPVLESFLRKECVSE